MMPFAYVRARTEAEAFAALAEPDTVAIAGGTTLVDLMRLEVMRPKKVVDVTGLSFGNIVVAPNAVSIGALASNTDVAYHPAIAARFPVLAEALLSGASAQLRNMATIGGNLLQRTRCPYFRDLGSPCNKRIPGSGCSAIDGYTRSHAVIGVSSACIASNPSDMAVALLALDAIVYLRSARGERAVPIADFHTLPGAQPHIETVMQPGELVTHVELPVRPMSQRSKYVKVRDRASFAFALASAGVALAIHGGKIQDARIALGGVGTKPWRESAVEQLLVGSAPGRDAFKHAAQIALQDAKPHPDNAFKVELARRTLVRALELAGGTP